MTANNPYFGPEAREGGGLRLDASESVFFKRQLETIAPRLYNVQYPEFLARTFVPTIGGLPDWAKVFIYRGYELVGTAAKPIADYAADLPRAGAKGAEVSQLIKTVGASFGYSRDEVRIASATNTPLLDLDAKAARRFVDMTVDTWLSLGDAQNGITGVLRVSGATTETALTKTSGGTAWALTGVADEIAFDVLALVAKIALVTKMAYTRFNVCLPIAHYNILSQKRMGDGSNMTILAYLLATSPYINSIKPWYQCTLAGGSLDATRMAAIPVAEDAVGALVPQEFMMEMPQERNLETVVNCTARCGGVVPFQPLAIGYMDSI